MAEDMVERAKRVAEFFRGQADFRSRALSVGFSDGVEMRDAQADMLAELADLLAALSPPEEGR